MDQIVFKKTYSPNEMTWPALVCLMWENKKCQRFDAQYVAWVVGTYCT